MSCLHYKKDGTLDMRYKSSREFLQAQKNFHLNSDEYQCSSSLSEIDWSNKLYTSSDIKLNRDGSISRRSRAVKSGQITFNEHGKIDRNCEAVRLGFLVLNQKGKPDLNVHKDLEIPKNPGDYKTSVYRNQYEQQKFRKETKCPNDYDASHIIDLELARAILKSKRGLYLTASELHEKMKPLNKLLEQRPRYVNRANKENPENDHAMTQRIIELLNGQNIRRTRALDEKILQMIDALYSIPRKEMNPQIKYILDQLERIKPQFIQLY